MFKKIILVLAVILALLAAGLAYMMRGPDLTQFESLRQPRLVTLPSQKVILVEATGDPNTTVGPAFGLLFKTYFKIPGVPRGPRQPAPKARWPVSADSSRLVWIGKYALPVPDATTAIPDLSTPNGLKAVLTTWEYGDVAEILHVGPYAAEKPTVDRLHAFIQAQGYQTIGEHEEEYIKGPGMFGKGNPDKYYTIIRYRVKKTNPQTTP